MKVNGTSPFQKCLETKGISPDEQYDMCVTDVSLYYDKNTNDLEKAVCKDIRVHQCNVHVPLTMLHSL
jgi:hypothetical protein